jgi:hypothetical protein
LKDLEREALSLLSLFGLPKIVPHLSIGLSLLKELEREALSPLPLFGLPKIVPHFPNSSLWKLVKTRFLRYTFIIEKIRITQEA